MSVSNFDESDQKGGKTNDENFESIRDKNKKKTHKTTGDKSESESSTNTNFQFRATKSGDDTDKTYDEVDDYYRSEQIRQDIQRQSYIQKFTFIRAPAPRSERMIGNNSIFIYPS